MELIKHFYFESVFPHKYARIKSRPVLRAMLFLLTSLFILSVASAQTSDSNNSSFRKYGIGAGYGFNSPLNDNLHPFEVSLQYHLSIRHIMYLTIPFLKKENGYVSGTPYTTGPNVGWSVVNINNYLWGIELGYHYSLLNYKGISLFAGAGLSYQSLEEKASIYGWSNYSFISDPPQPSQGYSSGYRDDNVYSFIPQAGAQYVWKYISVELKYKPYFSAKKYDFEDYRQLRGSAEFTYKSYQRSVLFIKNAFSCSFFFYF